VVGIAFYVLYSMGTSRIGYIRSLTEPTWKAVPPPEKGVVEVAQAGTSALRPTDGLLRHPPEATGLYVGWFPPLPGPESIRGHELRSRACIHKVGKRGFRVGGSSHYPNWFLRGGERRRHFARGCRRDACATFLRGKPRQKVITGSHMKFISLDNFRVGFLSVE